MRLEEARQLLGVSSWAGPQEVDAAFRRLARVAHPDRGGDAAVFQRLVDARALLRIGWAHETGEVGSGPPGARGTRSVLTVRRSSTRRVLHALRRRLPAAAPPRVR